MDRARSPSCQNRWIWNGSKPRSTMWLKHCARPRQQPLPDVEPLISLIVGERLSGQWPEQPIHLALVVAHLLELGLHVRDHAVRRFSTVTHIDRGIVGIILGRRIVTPRRIPVAVVPVIVTATD